MSVLDWISAVGDVFSAPFNIDGTPMFPNTGLDINGNAYGVTDGWLTDSSPSFTDTCSIISFDPFNND